MKTKIIITKLDDRSHDVWLVDEYTGKICKDEDELYEYLNEIKERKGEYKVLEYLNINNPDDKMKLMHIRNLVFSNN